MVEVNPGKITSEFRPLFNRKRSIVRWLKKQSIIYMKEIFSRLCFQTGLRLIMREVCLMLTECSEQINPSPYMFYFSSDDIEVAVLHRKRL